MGFITFDALCRPVTQIPPDGDTYFVEELTLAVSGAAGRAVIVAAKHGLKVRAVGGVGYDDMGLGSQADVRDYQATPDFIRQTAVRPGQDALASAQI